MFDFHTISILQLNSSVLILSSKMSLLKSLQTVSLNNNLDLDTETSAWAIIIQIWQRLYFINICKRLVPPNLIRSLIMSDVLGKKLNWNRFKYFLFRYFASIFLHSSYAETKTYLFEEVAGVGFF